MNRLTRPAVVKALLQARGVRLKKALGQNFLVDANVLAKIIAAAELSREDRVVEIGAGIGTLTAALAREVGKVLALEIDQDLLPILAETVGGEPGVEIVARDAREVDWELFLNQKERGSGGAGVAEAGGTTGLKYKVVANLPYYLTTPLLFNLLAASHCFSLLVLMLQREVAARLAAAPGGKEYGVLSVMVQYRATVEEVAVVPPSCFFPPPEVASAVVRLRPYPAPPVEVGEEAVFFRLVRAAFSQRRKTLANALFAANLLGGRRGEKQERREAVWGFLEENGIDPMRRGETLSLAEFARLSCALSER